MNNVLDEVLQQAKQNPEGFTVSIVDFSSPTNGWVVAFKETQDCFGVEGAKKVIDFARFTTNLVGGWCNEDGTMQFDAVMIIQDVQEAIKKAVENKQRYIYNLETGAYIKTL
ncbi:hypothetical protein CAPN008_05970 [Capnocytophaga canis]|uniref:hypothetical protein n=1 Tax=Capnocytophaga canis TaxID=1848903 RepID=UPI001AD244A7|nr:hypothetical protein [Capnocytophaga canis]GIM60547.1 hypothetical protein CAPN008_05970 [Capnocytophaga canis]